MKTCHEVNSLSLSLSWIVRTYTATIRNSIHRSSKWGGSNPRSIAHFDVKMPFEDSNLPGARPIFPDSRWYVWKLTVSYAHFTHRSKDFTCYEFPRSRNVGTYLCTGEIRFFELRICSGWTQTSRFLLGELGGVFDSGTSLIFEERMHMSMCCLGTDPAMFASKESIVWWAHPALQSRKGTNFISWIYP